MEEKEKFWNQLVGVIDSIHRGERVVLREAFNGHVGEGNRGDEEVIGRFGIKDRNFEGQPVVYFAKRMEMAVSRERKANRPGGEIVRFRRVSRERDQQRD